MTAVLGHLTSTEFGHEYKNWFHPPPVSLFNAPIVTSVAGVRPAAPVVYEDGPLRLSRTKRMSQGTSRSRLDTAEPSSSGQIVIVKASILEARSGRRL